MWAWMTINNHCGHGQVKPAPARVTAPPWTLQIRPPSSYLATSKANSELAFVSLKRIDQDNRQLGFYLYNQMLIRCFKKDYF